MTPADREMCTRAFTAVAPLTAAEIRAATTLFSPREMQRGDHLLHAGDRAHLVAIVVTGVLREYFVMANGDERTKAFVCEGQLSGSLADLLSPISRAHIVALEPTRLLVAELAELQALIERSPAWRTFAYRATQRLFLAKAEREYELLGLDAEARYAAFRTRFPGLEARVAARHVASYLGITPVHLSRLRARGRAKRS